MTTVTTNNWDTAFGITFKAANAAIVKKASSPANFSGTHSALGQVTTVTAGFGDWQLSGGSGSIVQMTLPLKNGTVQSGGNSASYAGSADIQVNLAFIPQPGTQTNNLALDVASGATVLKVTLSSGPASAVDAIKGALDEWLAGNLDQFNHVFAAVDIDEQADTGDFTWLAPTHLGYAINTDGFAKVDDYLFGVLTMTQNRVGSALGPNLDPGIIPKGADAGFLVSAPLVLDQMFRQHITTLFKDATPDDFDTLNDGTSLFNTKALSLPDFTLSDGRVVQDAGVKADGFNLSIGSGSVVITFTGMTFTYHTGYTVVVNYRSVNTLSTDLNGHLQLTPTGDPTVALTIEEATSEKWKEIWEGVGIGIITAIIGACLGAAAEAALAARQAAQVAGQAIADAGAGAGGEMGVPLANVGLTPAEQVDADIDALQQAVANLQNPDAPMSFAGFFRANAFKLLGAAIGAAVGGGLAAIPTILDGYADGDRDKMPTLDKFSTNAIASTTWAGGTGYTLSSARLRGALQLGLTATPS